MTDDRSALDVVVGCVSDLTFEEIAPWVASLDECGFRGRRVVIHLKTEANTVAELNNRGYETYDASFLHRGGNSKLKEKPSGEDIAVDRYFYIWYFLSRHAATVAPRYVVCTDVSDVIFQKNPTLWLDKRMGEKSLLVSSESLHFEDEQWGTQAMRASYGHIVWEAFRRSLIYNSGTIAGRFDLMMDLCLQIYFLSPGDRVPYSDQMALNLLLGSGQYRAVTFFASSEEGWACQCGTTADPSLRQQTKGLLTCPEPVFDGQYVRTASGEVFTIVHQYNRVPKWNKALRAKYQTAKVKRKAWKWWA